MVIEEKMEYSDVENQITNGIEERVTDKFLTRVRSFPYETAIIHENIIWTYAEVELHSRVLAGRLQKLGITDGSRVALLAERGPELVWAMIAVLRLGGIFGVLDSSYPQERLETLLDLCMPDALLWAGNDSMVDTANSLARSRNFPVIQARRDFGIDPFNVEELDQASPGNPAYFLFTSGSTGSPKCVVNSHRPLVNFISWQVATFDLEQTDRFSMLSGISHDPVLRDIFTPLAIGATIAIPLQITIIKPGALQLWLRDLKVTVAHLTPAMGQLIAAGGKGTASLPDMRHFFWGGDQLRPKLVAGMSFIAPAARQTNFYGCTETPQAVAFYPISKTRHIDTIPIGKNTSGIRLSIVDCDKRAVQLGVIGEIAVTSDFPSIGYIKDGTVVPLNISTGNVRSQTYYTGDRGTMLPSGDIVMLGRADDQVKIRGFRVDLSEISSVLQSHPMIHSAIALAVEDGVKLQINAFVCLSEHFLMSEKEVLHLLQRSLPTYMLPSRIWIMESNLPLLPNGKINRAALRAYAQASTELTEKDIHLVSDDGDPISVPETALIQKWESIFGSAKVSSSSSFVSLGGDSLSYVESYLATEGIIGSPPLDWTNKTLSELALCYVEKRKNYMEIDTALIIRALSISLIVAYHFNLIRYGNGLTGAMFMVSGYLFGRIQFPRVLKTRSCMPIIASIGRLLVPTICFLIILVVWHVARGEHVSLTVVTLTLDFIDHALVTGQFKDLLVWYIACLIHILMLLSATLYFYLFVIKKSFPAHHVAMWIFTAGCLFRFGIPIIVDPAIIFHGTSEMSFFQVSPTTHFASFMLGVVIVSIPLVTKKYSYLSLILAFAALSTPFFGILSGAVIACTGVILQFRPKVALPRPMAAIVLSLSGASLFIYLTHAYFGYAVRAVHGADWAIVQVPVALLGGVCVQAAWNWGAARLRGHRRSCFTN